LAPTADATLSEAFPENSLGGASFFNAGTTQNFTRNHGLIRFDPLQKIPAGATVTSVRMSLEVLRKPRDGFAAVQMGLYRMLQSWGEGSTLPSLPDTSPGAGGSALDGEATWGYRYFNTTNAWAEPGGSPGKDYVARSSSVAFIFGVEDSPYEFPSSDGLIADVQRWLDHPEENQGWMLRPLDEGPNFTARRYGSRESDAPPVLYVDFIPPPLPAWVLGVVRVTDTALVIHFKQLAGLACQLESAHAFGAAAWTRVREFPAPAADVDNEVVVDLGGELGLLRVVGSSSP
jgi:hypothetical protein